MFDKTHKYGGLEVENTTANQKTPKQKNKLNSKYKKQKQIASQQKAKHNKINASYTKTKFNSENKCIISIAATKIMNNRTLTKQKWSVCVGVITLIADWTKGTAG